MLLLGSNYKNIQAFNNYVFVLENIWKQALCLGKTKVSKAKQNEIAYKSSSP